MSDSGQNKGKITIGKAFDVFFKVALVILIILSLRSMIGGRPAGLMFYIAAGVALVGWLGTVIFKDKKPKDSKGSDGEDSGE